MAIKAEVIQSAFNQDAELPFELRLKDFEIAMQDVYDFFADVNTFFNQKGLPRLDDVLRPAIMSGVLSDMLTSSLSKHCRSLTQNEYFNGHPDLIVNGRYPHNKVKAGEHGIEIKTTSKKGGAVDMHGARNQWLCVFVYERDTATEPAERRDATRFTELYLSRVTVEDFRKNARGELGTRTATVNKEGLSRFRANWIYKL